MKLVTVPVADLKSHPRNPRVGNVDLIRASIRQNGWYGVVLVQAETNYIVAGNHRVEAARQEGIESVPVVYLDVDDERAERILLADNRLGDWGGYDDTKLLDILQSVAASEMGLAGTGWSRDELEDLDFKLGEMRMADLHPVAFPTPDFGLPTVGPESDAEMQIQVIVPMTVGQHSEFSRLVGDLMREKNLADMAEAILYVLRRA